MSGLATSNLWHLLHILTPALADGNACLAAKDCDLLVDGLHLDSAWTEGMSPLDAIRQSFAWPFLKLLSLRTPLLLGAANVGQPSKRCFWNVYWGYRGVTLFGRDKGGLSTATARSALTRVTARSQTHPLFLRMTRSPLQNAEVDLQRWRILLIERRIPARRALANCNQIIQLLCSRLLRRRAIAVWKDFADQEMKSDVQQQWQLASSADILIGAHGAGLAWAAFMPAGSVMIELMPHMQVLHQQLCRVKPGETIAWDATPMYAYGGLSALMGLHHICIIGLPTAALPSRPSLGLELGTWWSSDVVANISALNHTLLVALDHLDALGQTYNL
ncbi:Kif1c, partial [Symbiodinium pilosum]